MEMEYIVESCLKTAKRHEFKINVYGYSWIFKWASVHIVTSMAKSKP